MLIKRRARFLAGSSFSSMQIISPQMLNSKKFYFFFFLEVFFAEVFLVPFFFVEVFLAPFFAFAIHHLLFIVKLLIFNL